MLNFRHLENVTTLTFDPSKCVGCGICATVCPHRVFAVEGGQAAILDREACMECGACALNCPTQAITVTPGVGCASLIIQTWLPWKRGTRCC